MACPFGMLALLGVWAISASPAGAAAPSLRAGGGGAEEAPAGRRLPWIEPYTYVLDSCPAVNAHLNGPSDTCSPVPAACPTTATSTTATGTTTTATNTTTSTTTSTNETWAELNTTTTTATETVTSTTSTTRTTTTGTGTTTTRTTSTSTTTTRTSTTRSTTTSTLTSSTSTVTTITLTTTTSSTITITATSSTSTTSPWGDTNTTTRTTSTVSTSTSTESTTTATTTSTTSTSTTATTSTLTVSSTTSISTTSTATSTSATSTETSTDSTTSTMTTSSTTTTRTSTSTTLTTTSTTSTTNTTTTTTTTTEMVTVVGCCRSVAIPFTTADLGLGPCAVEVDWGDPTLVTLDPVACDAAKLWDQRRTVEQRCCICGPAARFVDVDETPGYVVGRLEWGPAMMLDGGDAEQHLSGYRVYLVDGDDARLKDAGSYPAGLDYYPVSGDADPNPACCPVEPVYSEMVNVSLDSDARSQRFLVVAVAPGGGELYLGERTGEIVDLRPTVRVRGSFELVVANPAAFVASEDAAEAVAVGIARLLGLPSSHLVAVTLSLVSRRLSAGGEAGARRRLSGTVAVEFEITVPADRTAAGVAAALESRSASEVVSAMNEGLQELGLQDEFAVESATVPGLQGATSTTTTSTTTTAAPGSSAASHGAAAPWGAALLALAALTLRAAAAATTAAA